MQSILIFEEDREYRNQMVEIFSDAGYSVTVTDSVENAIGSILNRMAQVVVIGTKCDALTTAALVPIMKQCNPKISIILVSADISLGLLRKLRGEGIFYHALKVTDSEGREEVRQAVDCAFENMHFHPV